MTKTNLRNLRTSSSKSLAVIFPHQLDWPLNAIPPSTPLFLLEHPLYFPQTPVHRQRLMLMRAAMRRWHDDAQHRGFQVTYVESSQAGLRKLAAHWQGLGFEEVVAVDPSDDWLTRRFVTHGEAHKLSLHWLPNPHFLTTTGDWEVFSQSKKKLFFTEFYIQQRKRHRVLIDDSGKPEQGKWSFDAENRKRLPKGISLPTPPPVEEDGYHQEAREYVRRHFPAALGSDLPLLYPSSREGAWRWYQSFLETSLPFFGDYEDAIARDQSHLFHSVLTPMLNLGLLSPAQVLEAAIAQKDRVPFNALEGFVRQILGWREFVHQVYRSHGRAQRTANFFDHQRSIPSSFYDANTGIEPVDQTLRKVLRSGYCHHIERLMILGNFMLLCEFHPNEVYRWFMEFFVDAYDWVMVPNIYGMSQHADGGMITTKPYISGSAYVLRMSDYRQGPWCEVWDALYWRFIAKHREFYANNPRCSVMTHQLDKLGPRLDQHLQTAETFLSQLREMPHPNRS